MKQRIIYLLTIILFLLANSAWCQTPLPDGYKKQTIFSDDFSDNHNKWLTKSTSSFTTKVENGFYHIEGFDSKALWVNKPVLVNTNYDYEIEIKFRCFARAGGSFHTRIGDSVRTTRVGFNGHSVFNYDEYVDYGNCFFIDGNGGMNTMVLRKFNNKSSLWINGCAVKEFWGIYCNSITQIGFSSFLGILEIKSVDISYIQKADVVTAGNNKPKLSAEASRGLSIKSETSEAPITTGKSYAFIIADENYTGDIPALTHPLEDARKLAEVLKKDYVFDSVKVLKNPGKAEIVRNLYAYRKMITPEDNLLIFYSGHGHWDKESDQGYWLPVDAADNDPSNWISNSEIKDQLKAIKSLHTLLISDACFAGGIFKTRDAQFQHAPRAVKELYSLKSRRAMTSGTLTEVPDESVFMKYLLQAMTSNTDKYLSSESLFRRFKENAINNSKMDKLIPQFGVINDVDDEGGDFIFVRKQ